VEVRVVLDKSQSYSQYAFLKAAGIEVRNDTNWEGTMHDKVAAIDHTIVLTASFNWTGTAENNNNENLIVIHSVDIASRYESEFQKIWNMAQG
jgi:phosphatidylserine/phosphatidylglycerophosphate/cardiolipin synthase-like enzyme